MIYWLRVDETFTLELLRDTNDAASYVLTNIIEDTIATGTILDNDSEPENTPPVANDDSVSTDEDTAITFTTADLLANDIGR